MRTTFAHSMIVAVLAAASSIVNAATAPATDADRLTIQKVPLPGEGRGDYLFVDPSGKRLFVTHTTVVHIIDVKTLKQIAQVSGLTYAHGVASDNRGRGYVADGNSNSVVVFDPASGRELKRIKVGDRPDGLLFDSTSAKIMAFNADSNSVSVIDPASGSVAGTIKLPYSPENAQSDDRGHVYVNFEEGNAVGVIDTVKMALVRIIPLKGCEGPAPLAIDKTNRRLFSGCDNNVMNVTDADTGKAVASVRIGSGPDGIVYDAGTRRIFVGNKDGAWTVVRQSGRNSYSLERTLKIDEYAKTLALDPKTHRVFSSSADLVWPPAVPGKKHLPNAKSGTFRLIVVSQL